jgi:hypothetical protein
VRLDDVFEFYHYDHRINYVKELRGMPMRQHVSLFLPGPQTEPPPSEPSEEQIEPNTE